MRLVCVGILLLAAGCAAAPRVALSSLEEMATQMSSFPAVAGSYMRIGWEFDSRAITALYRTRHGVATARITRTICDLGEPDPQRYVAPQLLLRAIQRRKPHTQARQRGTLSYNGVRFNYIEYVLPTTKGSGSGCIAGAVLGPLQGKYHLLVVEASSRLEEQHPKQLLEPIVSAVFRE